MLDLARIRALCFDVDGTIADTDDHLVAQLAGVLVRLPLVSGRRASRVARQVVMAAESPVNAAYEAIDRAGWAGRMHRAKDLARRLRAQRRHLAGRRVAAVDEVPHDMVPDVQQMLDVLAEHYPMSVISTGGVPRIEAFLAHYDVRRHMTAVVGAGTTERMKPDAEPLRYAAEAMGVAPEHCLMIGDTTVDMRTAAAAGAQAVGVLCGFGTRDELIRTGADLVLETTSDLLAVLLPDADPLHGRTADPAPLDLADDAPDPSPEDA